MDKKSVFEEKHDLLKIEMNILNSRTNQSSTTAWKIRQMCLTLWLGCLGFGLGALFNFEIPHLVYLSIFIPVPFMLMDLKETALYFKYEFRVDEIKQLINNTNDESILSFPLYDLRGSDALKKISKQYNWHTKNIFSMPTTIPFLYYSLQLVASAFLISWIRASECGGSKGWYAIPVVLAFVLFIFYLIARHVRKKLKKEQAT